MSAGIGGFLGLTVGGLELSGGSGWLHVPAMAQGGGVEMPMTVLAAALVGVMLLLLVLIVKKLRSEGEARGDAISRMGSTAIRRDLMDGDPAPSPAPSPVPPRQEAPIPITREIPLRPEPEPGPSPDDASGEKARARELDGSDPAKAAAAWQELTHWKEAARAYREAGELEEATRILLALGKSGEALDVQRQLADQHPSDDKVAIRFVETLVEHGRHEEALEELQRLAGEGAEGKRTPHFLHGAGVIHESLGDYEAAVEYYRKAMKAGCDPQKCQPRIDFATQMVRLGGDPEPSELRNSSAANEILQRYIHESTQTGVPADAGEPSLPDPPEPGYRMIVGHLALGFEEQETQVRPRSIYSLVRRFELRRLVAETPRGATFEANDRLLDYPVALKIHRLTEGREAVALLEKRLRAIARLNHPNLAKLTFADRIGPILRQSSEYLPGGNLRDFLGRLGGVGYPLIIRITLHIASALHSAHLRGIPHGDLRPENVIIGPDQRLKLIDFALCPIPVTRQVDFDSREIPPRPDTYAHQNDGVNSDLLQMGELIEFMMQHARPISPPTGGAASPATRIDPGAELREVADRIRRGSFQSAISLWQVLDRLFEQALPTAPTPPSGSTRQETN